MQALPQAGSRWQLPSRRIVQIERMSARAQEDVCLCRYVRNGKPNYGPDSEVSLRSGWLVAHGVQRVQQAPVDAIGQGSAA